MTDDDRVRLATPSGSLMLGPLERERCAKHPRRWRIFRWVWEVDGDISASDPVVVRSCGSCLEEEQGVIDDE